MTTWKKWLLGILFAFITLVIIAVNSDKKKTTPTDNTQATDPTPSSIQVSAKDLFKDYSKNEVAADDTYKGKTIDVSGKVVSINKGMADDIYIILKADDIISGVDCFLNDDNKSKAAQLSKGQNIIIEGEGDGLLMGSPQIKNCTIK